MGEIAVLSDKCRLVPVGQFGLVSTNIKMKIHRTVILPFVLYGCET
jgi:hypothetical protein